MKKTILLLLVTLYVCTGNAIAQTAPQYGGIMSMSDDDFENFFGVSKSAYLYQAGSVWKTNDDTASLRIQNLTTLQFGMDSIHPNYMVLVRDYQLSPKTIGVYKLVYQPTGKYSLLVSALPYDPAAFVTEHSTDTTSFTIAQHKKLVFGNNVSNTALVLALLDELLQEQAHSKAAIAAATDKSVFHWIIDGAGVVILFCWAVIVLLMALSRKFRNSMIKPSADAKIEAKLSNTGDTFIVKDMARHSDPKKLADMAATLFVNLLKGKADADYLFQLLKNWGIAERVEFAPTDVPVYEKFLRKALAEKITPADIFEWIDTLNNKEFFTQISQGTIFEEWMLIPCSFNPLQELSATTEEKPTEKGKLHIGYTRDWKKEEEERVAKAAAAETVTTVTETPVSTAGIPAEHSDYLPKS